MMPIRRIKKTASGTRRPVSANRYLEDEEEESDEEEAPRRTRTPASRRNLPNRGPRRVQDEEEEETPRRRSRRVEDEEEEESPRRKARSRGRDEDDEDYRPRKRRDEDELSPVGQGWKAHKEKSAQMKTRGDFPTKATFTDEPSLYKFVEDEPFAVFGQHWINELDGQKGHVCLEKNCPLDAIGDSPREITAYNVIKMPLEEGEEPELQILECGPMATEQAENFSNSRNGPLSKNYWALSKSKKKGSGRGGGVVVWNWTPVKERDFEEDDWGEPLTDDEIDDFAEKAWTAKEYPKITSRKRLEELVEELED